MTQSPNPKSRREVKAMSDEELKVAVAKLHGWKVRKDGHLWSLLRPCRSPVLGSTCAITIEDGLAYIPNYPRDLNAMHEAENVFTELKQQDEYNRQLEQIHKETRILWKDVTGFVTVHSTARQRAEAFVLTLTESPNTEER